MQPGSPKPFTGVQLMGRLQLRAGSWFSMASSLSVLLSQLMWKRVTRGFEAKMFRWSWGRKRNVNCQHALSLLPQSQGTPSLPSQTHEEQTLLIPSPTICVGLQGMPVHHDLGPEPI